MPVIPTPEQELDSFKDQPNVSPNELAHAERYTRGESIRRRKVGLDWVRKAKQRNQDRCAELAKTIREETRAADDLIVMAQDGAYDSIDELVAELTRLRRAQNAHANAISAVATTEETISGVEANPDGYYEAFFEKWPALAHQVPRLADEMNRYRSRR
ncbi:hypothetical protein [Nocardioides caricicola]|uniref:Uncharacterized protein n=1 Tax=Nocardioides caricicola TaxID=634770 RepID=A0ABW0N1I0_9ACTN